MPVAPPRFVVAAALDRLCFFSDVDHPIPSIIPLALVLFFFVLHYASYCFRCVPEVLKLIFLFYSLPPELARNAKRLRKPPGTVTDWTFLRGYRVMFQGEEVLTVAGCVGAVVNVFDKSCSYVEQIKEISDADTSDLKISLVRGKEVVRSQYARESKKLGWVFAQGDGESNPYHYHHGLSSS